MKHSQPHTTLYCADILLSWGGRIYRNVESLIMILLFPSASPFAVPCPFHVPSVGPFRSLRRSVPRSLLGGSPLYYEVSGKTLAVTIFKATVV